MYNSASLLAISYKFFKKIFCVLREIFFEHPFCVVNMGFDRFSFVLAEVEYYTIQYYKNSLRQLLHKYGDFYVKNIGSTEIKEIEKQLSGMSKESIISYKKGMKIFFGYLITEKFISENPIGKIEMTHNRKVVVMTDEELEEILYYFENRNKDHYNLIKFLVLSGFRISEAISLKWDDIKKDHIIVGIKKEKEKIIFH